MLGKHVHPSTRQGLIQTGGGIVKASTWYVSFNPIPPEAVNVVGIRGDDGSYTPCRTRSEVHRTIIPLKLPGVRLVPTADVLDGDGS